MELRNVEFDYLLDLRKRRENDHKETLKTTEHLEKGVDYLYDAETNSHRERNGSGRNWVWNVSKKIKGGRRAALPSHQHSLERRCRTPREPPFFHDQDSKICTVDALSKA